MTAGNLDQVANLREQILCGCVLVVLTVVFLRVVYFPKSQQIDVTVARVQGLRLERDALKKFSESTPVIGFQTLAGGSQGVKMKILSGDVRPAFQEVTELLAEITHPRFLGGVQIRTLNYLPPMVEKGYQRVDFTLQVSGGFSQVTQYLERLEEFPALFTVQDFSMNVGDGSPNLQAEITGRFYQTRGAASPPLVMSQGEGG